MRIREHFREISRTVVGCHGNVAAVSRASMALPWFFIAPVATAPVATACHENFRGYNNGTAIAVLHHSSPKL